MGYKYNSATLLHKVDSSTNAHSQNLLADAAVIAFGELLQLTIAIGHDNPAHKFQTGRWYIFNPCMFAQTAYATALPTSAEGYLISVTGSTGALLCSVQTIGNSSTTPLVQNLTLSATIDATDKVMSLVLTFWATADIKSYLGQNFVSNDFRLQNSSILSPIYTVASNDVYGSLVSYFECFMYEADQSNNFLPRYAGGIHADPYVRDSSNPSYKQLSRIIKGKFFDNEIGNIQAISVGNTFAYNSLSGMKVGTSPTNILVAFDRKPYPYLDATIDNNFVLSFGAQPSFVHNGLNIVSFTIKEGTAVGFTTNKVALTIIDCTRFANTANFPTEYNLERIALTANDLTPAPNWLNGGTSIFGTPAQFSTGVSTVVSFYLNGAKLTLGHRYRILVQLYDNIGNVSTHVSPSFIIADLEDTSIPTLTGTIETLADTFTGNNLSVSPFERVRLSLEADATLTPDFTNQLTSVSLVSSYADGQIVTSSYNFQAQAAINQPTIEYSNVGALHTFACSFRPNAIAPFTASKNSTHTWFLVLNQALSNGTQQNVIIGFEQRLTVRALDTPARFTTLRVLDYSEFQIGNIVPINQLCVNDTKAVVEIEKNFLGTANPAALFFTANPITQSVYTVDEDENFASATNLVTLQGTYVENTDANFAANLAYYEIDLTLLNPSTVYYIGAIIYEN